MSNQFSAIDAARECLDLIESFDIAGAAARFAPEGVLELPMRPEPLARELRGAEIEKFMRLLPKLFARLRFVERRYHQTTTARTAVVEYKGDAVTHTGTPYLNTYIAVFEFDEQGRVLLWREYFDPLVLQQTFAG
ncbi:MAG: nuclear transport factor 2 family protein [Actinomycetota bacterium]|nr:nuclear transport factor 2 family protein [Actinomycetota bacterium]